jgi:hypothetical protein
LADLGDRETGGTGEMGGLGRWGDGGSEILY